MARWAHGYSGHTHATKVADCESILRKAVEEFSASEAPGTPPNFSKMAARVLQARLKLLGATLAKLEEPRRGGLPLEQIDKIEERIFELESGGVEAILREFSAPEL